MVPWKLIVFLIILTLFVVFAGLNINNVSDISVGFTTVQDVPIFLSLFIAFLAGAFFMVPFAFRKGKKTPPASKVKKERPPQPQPEPQPRNPLEFQNEIIEGEPPADKKKDGKL